MKNDYNAGYMAGMEYVIDSIISSNQNLDQIIAELIYELSIMNKNE